MSGLFKSTVIKGTKMTDFSSTAAEVGIPLPFGYGRVPVPGNVIFAPMPPVEHRQVKRQGKGGVKQETFTYTLSYAVAFLQGPAYGYWWIKRNGKIVYTQDPNAPIEDRDYAAKWAQRVNFYNGTVDQMPDSVIESYEGAGNVSAFRKLVYFSVEDEDVTDNGGAPPNYEACIIASPPEVFLTSPLYPIEAIDSMSASMELPSADTLYPPIDRMTASMTMLSGELNLLVRYLSYTDGVTEPLQASMEMLSGELNQLVRYLSYTLGVPEPLEASMVMLSGELNKVAGYLTYTNGIPDPLQASMTMLSGSLAPP